MPLPVAERRVAPGDFAFKPLSQGWDEGKKKYSLKIAL